MARGGGLATVQGKGIGIALCLGCRVYDHGPSHGESEAKNAGCNSNWVLTGM